MNHIQFESFGPQNNWICDGYHDSNSNKTISVVSPYFDQEIATVPDSNIDDLEQAVNAARKAFPSWSRLNIRDRAEIMYQFKTILEYP